MNQRPYTMDTLLGIMAKLRDPEVGCPWDQQQHWQSIVPHTVEETYELVDAINQAIESKDFSDVKLELGDVLFQVVFYAQFGQEQGDFNFADVVDGICEKLIRRHPHVFTEQDFADEAAIKANWEAEKAKERAGKSASKTSVLDDVPMALPALSRAQKLQKRCANVGFDWPSVEPVIDKVKEELEEVQEAIASKQSQDVAEEIGDLLFSCVNLARACDFDAEDLLRQANQKFSNRFRGVEALAAESGKNIKQMSLEDMDALWDKVKENYKN
ncbi:MULTISPECIES: nucleoside triphosphate pyrophosphohydrolase [unclassified Agarivorans]|uniref:nucleoside triphosphate pyrophosphohydrolase n=1 Tax=unclassified Agarivorans TaxID=2636026 RepID=UPI0026E267E2|nr:MULTISPECIES: nucleoside triphosphate pyrophosphohydrolase [unclassified Agarivorans]MDO6684294.1 nucleoside triphosphate pyrophosphohydrolase [Agarivorans sp. 3_MG-2023]MDO6714460.1 nucleoside triphosphate pyrophosphohydrolase [Agarivorans sp. 2_MG-2023]